ncbi:MAG: M48 family metallopeptidase [candidate division WOR-3 bacterium]
MQERTSFYDQQTRNKRIATIFWITLVFIFALVGAAIPSVFQINSEAPFLIRPVLQGALYVGGFGLIYMLIAYYIAAPILLKRLHARPVNSERLNELAYRNTVEEMSIAAGIPVPEAYIIDDNTWLNAFASGKSEKQASICITSGLLNILNREELQGVIGHEISHIKSQDTKSKFTYIAAVGLLAIIALIGWKIFLLYSTQRKALTKKEKDQQAFMLAIVGFVLIVAIIAKVAEFFARLLALAIGRRQEYLADIGSVQLTRNPTALANALKKISDYHQPRFNVSFAEAPLFISNPKIKNINKPNFIENLFSTHPPIQTRIQKLEAMGADNNS